MTKLIKVTHEQVRAARLELQALESAGLRPDPMLRKLAQALVLLPEETEAVDNGEAIDIVTGDGVLTTGTKADPHTEVIDIRHRRGPQRASLDRMLGGAPSPLGPDPRAIQQKPPTEEK